MVQEAPGGEPASGSGGKDNSSSVECPTCGKDNFNSVQYMKVHHSHAHGESIAGKLVECYWCGDEFRRSPSTVEKIDRNYCSDECRSKGRSERYSGEGHPRYVEDKPVIECDHCGKEFEVVPANKDKARFCSGSCRSKWYSGERSPLYTRVTVECEICGEEVKRKPSHLEEQENVFCSYDCHREYQSIHQVGENHHNYNGGRAKEYGPNWHRQRRKAIERDNEECQRCGVHRSELDRDINVHHIVERKAFIDDDGVFDYKEANKLDNLISLCGSCHQICENWGLRLSNI